MICEDYKRSLWKRKWRALARCSCNSFNVPVGLLEERPVLVNVSPLLHSLHSLMAAFTVFRDTSNVLKNSFPPLSRLITFNSEIQHMHCKPFDDHGFSSHKKPRRCRETPPNTADPYLKLIRITSSMTGVWIWSVCSEYSHMPAQAGYCTFVHSSFFSNKKKNESPFVRWKLNDLKFTECDRLNSSSFHHVL